MKHSDVRHRIVGICAMALGLCAVLAMDPPEPVSCALCGSGDGRRYNAPCVLECSTGLLAELAAHVEDPAKPGKLHVFQMGCCSRVGIEIDWEGGVQTCTVSLPEQGKGMRKRLFCRRCRRLLAGAGKRGYVLADLYDPGHITVYPICAGEALQLREYGVFIRKEGRRCRIEVTLF